MRGKFWLLRPHGVQRALRVARLERQAARDHRVQAHPGAPRVDGARVVPAHACSWMGETRIGAGEIGGAISEQERVSG